MSRQGRALAVLVAASAALATSVHAYVGASKSVVLVVDGIPERMTTMSRTVDELLAHSNLSLSDLDQVTPSRNAALTENAVVTVDRVRKVAVDLDGELTTHLLTARDVESALTQIGIHPQAWVSVARSTTIGLEGVALKVRAPKRVVVSVAGKRTSLVTTAPHVRGVLKQAKVSLGTLDRVNQRLTAAPHKGMLIAITRVKQERVTKTERIAFATKRIYDKTMLEYKRVLKSSGRSGSKRTTYLLTYENGKVVKRSVVRSEVLKPAKNAVVVIGTKKRTLDQLNWTRLAKCESHGNPRAVSKGGLYHGLFQFALTTWKSVGGTGKPSQASPAEQLMRAKLLYVKRGAQPWPHCGRLLFTD